MYVCTCIYAFQLVVVETTCNQEGQLRRFDLGGLHFVGCLLSVTECFVT